VLTLHEYLAICAHYGQMVTKPDLALCERASPQRCHRCYPELDQRAFFLRELWLKRFLHEVDLFIAPSRFLRDRFVAWGLPRSASRCSRTCCRRRLLRRRRRAGQGPFRAGFFGQLSRLKGVDVLLRAAAVLEERGAAAVIEVHGSAEHQPPEFRDYVRAALAGRRAG
jgi:glycosyltransferase involved in cell wall biosynthesis